MQQQQQQQQMPSNTSSVPVLNFQPTPTNNVTQAGSQPPKYQNISNIQQDRPQYQNLSEIQQDNRPQYQNISDIQLHPQQQHSQQPGNWSSNAAQQGPQSRYQNVSDIYEENPRYQNIADIQQGTYSGDAAVVPPQQGPSSTFSVPSIHVSQLHTNSSQYQNVPGPQPSQPPQQKVQHPPARGQYSTNGGGGVGVQSSTEVGPSAHSTMQTVSSLPTGKYKHLKMCILTPVYQMIM